MPQKERRCHKPIMQTLQPSSTDSQRKTIKTDLATFFPSNTRVKHQNVDLVV